MPLLLRLLSSLIFRLLSFLLCLLLLILTYLLGLVELLLANLGVVVGLLLAILFEFLCLLRDDLSIVGDTLLAFFVLRAKKIGDGLKDVTCDAKLCAQESKASRGEARPAVVVRGGFLVLICNALLVLVMMILEGNITRTLPGLRQVAIWPQHVALGCVNNGARLLLHNGKLVLAPA